MSHLQQKSTVVAEALVREYLHRCGLKETLSAFDKERPRDVNCITNRNVLRKSLGLDRYAGRLKRKLPEDERLPATLDMLVSYQMLKIARPSTAPPGAKPSVLSDSPDANKNITRGGQQISRNDRITAGFQPQQKKTSTSSTTTTAAAGAKTTFTRPEIDSPAKQPSFNPRPPLSNSKQENGSATAKKSFLMDELMTISSFSRGSSGPSGMKENGHNGGVRHNAAAVTQRPSPPSRMMRPSSAPPKQQLLKRTAPSTMIDNDLVMEDVEDDFAFHRGSSAAPTTLSTTTSSLRDTTAEFNALGVRSEMQGSVPVPEEIDLSMLRSLESLLLGKGRASPPKSWIQGFYFSANSKLSYGIVQEEGGPCGVLAVVQASILDALMDMHPKVSEWISDPSLVAGNRCKALTKALSRIIKQSTSGQRLKIVGSSSRSTAEMTFREYLNSLVVYTVSSSASAETVLESLLAQLQERKGYGLITFLFSVLMTRGPSVITKDMDDSSVGLIGGYGYCTQDLVNLLLSGKAVTNVFNGDHALDEHTTLHGIQSRTRCGFLTIFEWYKHLEVGSYLKDSYKPIWVVNSESHFSVLFAADLNLNSSDKGKLGVVSRHQSSFDLYYYDELANQDDIIHLTVSRSPNASIGSSAETETGSAPPDEEAEDMPPLEKVIQTRWPKVSIDWNGSEPIL